MACLTEGHVEHALAYLCDSTHPSLVSFLALLGREPPIEGTPGAAAPAEFGGPEEHVLLAEYFQPEGGTTERPYYVPFGPGRAGDPRWKPRTYGCTSLQRMRQDRPFLFAPGPNTP